MNNGLIKEDDRELVIKLYKNGVRPASISERVGISLSSVYRFVKLHKTEVSAKADTDLYHALKRISASVDRIEELLAEINSNVTK